MEKRIKYFTKQQVKSFLYQCKCTSKRDYLLFYLMYILGLRRGEIALITWEKINIVEGTIWITALKGGNSRSYQLTKDVVKLLKEYKQTFKNNVQSDKPVFTGNSGNSLSKSQIQNLFHKYRKLARIKKGYTIHSFRHAIAMNMMNSGVSTANLDFVQKHLRHKDRRSTEVYAHMLDTTANAIFNEVLEKGALL